jgi:hypothetical protein
MFSMDFIGYPLPVTDEHKNGVNVAQNPLQRHGPAAVRGL